MKFSRVFTKAVAVFVVLLQLCSAVSSANEGVTRIKAYSPLSGVEVRLVETVADGEFLTYQVVECDLSNPNLRLEALYPTEGAGTLKGTKDIGADNGAQVAMNADYFNRGSQSGKGSAVGYNAVGGEMISNALEEKVYSFSYQNGGRYSFDIFSNQIKIGFGNRVFEYVKTYNKYSSLEGVAIYDKHWGKESLGSHGTLVELVIENNVLTQIRRDMPPAPIPENGFVLAGLSDLTTLFDQVQLGDSVTLEILTTPELSFLPDFTIGGGSMLVSRGKLVSEMSYPIGSTTAFPALGISQDGQTVWFITVVNQKGITQKKMGELCLAEGAYSAFNLDGGGSTQCAVVDNTTGKLQYIHELSGGYERLVANAIGVVSQNQNPAPYGISAEDLLVFSNIPKEISYSVYDENGKPLAADPALVSFTSKNNTFTVTDGFLTGNVPGEDVLTIRYGNLTKECRVTTILPGVSAVKNTDGTYQVTNADGYIRTVTAEEFKKTSGIPVNTSLSQPDHMTEDKGLPHALSLYGGSTKDDTLFQRLLPHTVIKKLPAGINPFGQESVSHPYVELQVIDNANQKIIRSDMTQWNKLTTALKSPKNNIILVMKEPLSFQRQQEEELFYETLSQAQQNGKNIFVVYRGTETRLQKLYDGVRVFSLEEEKGTITDFINRATGYLSVFCNETQMSYHITSEKLFAN